MPPKIIKGLFQTNRLEVKHFYVTDECKNCTATQGGYVDADIDRYENIRNGHYCVECGVSEVEDEDNDTL